jgi:hypothetical protein
MFCLHIPHFPYKNTIIVEKGEDLLPFRQVPLPPIVNQCRVVIAPYFPSYNTVTVQSAKISNNDSQYSDSAVKNHVQSYPKNLKVGHLIADGKANLLVEPVDPSEKWEDASSGNANSSLSVAKANFQNQ